MINQAKILIVDDNPANLIALRAILSRQDVTMIEANSGHEALSQTLKHEFALVLLDVHMPDMTGYEVASMLQNTPKTANIPVIFLTAAYKDEQHKIKGYDSGAVDYIEKPINEDILIPKVRYFLKLHSFQQQLQGSLQREKDFNLKLKAEIERRTVAEGRLKLAIEQANIATQSKSEFLATMSHEIRTPMNGVLGMAELLLHTPLNNSQLSQVNTIMSSGSLLLTILNDILDLSRLEAGRVELETIRFNLEHTLHEVMQLLSVRTCEKDMEMILDYPPEAPRYFLGDPARLRQIFNNLIGNAIKFTEHGYIRVRIESVPAGNNKSQITLCVEDTGIGISAKAIDKLFKPFSQADSSTTRKFGGTGLGLSICKQLTEVMLGTLWVESEPEKGSRFYLTICFEQTDPPEVLVQQDLSHLKILLVDDSTVNRELFSQYLEHFGIERKVIDDATQTLADITKAHEACKPYDIIMLDYNMPAKSGLEIARDIRSNSKFDQTKLIILTSSASRGDANLFEKAGFDAYLSKPIRSDLLRDTINSVIMNDSKNQHANSTNIITQHSVAESKYCQKQKFNGQILLVEDTIVNQKVALGMLESLGLRIDLASDGIEAIERHGKINYDLIFMDCRMPNMDGYEATEIIRAREKTSHTPIIALTANATLEDREKCTACGMDDIITKPFKLEQLASALEIWLKTDKNSINTPTVETELNIIASDSDAIDTEFFKMMEKNVGKVFPEVIDAFYESTPEIIQQISNWAENSNHDDFVRLPHSLKSSSANLGATNLSKLATYCEQLAKDDKISEVKAEVNNLKNEFDNVCISLKSLGY